MIHDLESFLSTGKETFILKLLRHLFVSLPLKNLLFPYTTEIHARIHALLACFPASLSYHRVNYFVRKERRGSAGALFGLSKAETRQATDC